MDLAIGPGLQVVSVGPNDVVEGWNLIGKPSARDPAGPEPTAQMLKIRLNSLARDQTKVILRLAGYQPIPRDGPVKLGLFAPDPSTASAAVYELTADRSLSVELDDDSGAVTRLTEAATPLKIPSPNRSASSPGGSPAGPSLVLTGSGGARSLPIRITRHARSVTQQTVLSAAISRRWVDLVQETTFLVRHGALGALEVRVPAGVADPWEVLERDVVDREELARNPDGSRRYRLVFDRPVLDKAVLRFHFRQPITPLLDTAEYRDVAISGISFDGVLAGRTRLEVSTAPGILFQGKDPAWIRIPDDGQPNRSGESPALAFTESPGEHEHPFTFKALALEPVELPPLVVPRLLIRSVEGFDGTIRSRARYWVETHGPVFPFAMPAGARWLAARVDGRVTEQVEFDSTRPGYRLRFPSDVGSRPVVVELEYQVPRTPGGSSWQPPQLLDGGIVLDTLWEVQLPWDRAIVGVPRGWSDENEWFWTGRIWKRRTWRDGTALDQWLGSTSSAATSDEHARGQPRRLASPPVQPSGPASGPGPLDPPAHLDRLRLLGSHPDPWLLRDLLRHPLPDGLGGCGRPRDAGRHVLAAERDPDGSPIGFHRSRSHAPGSVDPTPSGPEEADGDPGPGASPLGQPERRFVTGTAGHRRVGRLDRDPRSRPLDDGLRLVSNRRARGRRIGEKLNDGANLSPRHRWNHARSGIPINHDPSSRHSIGQASSTSWSGCRAEAVF